MQDAERLKTMHGGLVATGLDDRDMIELPSILGDWDHDRRQISRSELIGVMRPRVEEILEEVRARLDASGFEYLPSQRIVLTGGSAQIPGLESVGEPYPRAAVPDRQAAAGSRGCRSRPPEPPFRPPSASRCTSRHPQDECWDFEMPADRQGARRVTRALQMVQGKLVTSGDIRLTSDMLVGNPNILGVLT